MDMNDIGLTTYGLFVLAKHGHMARYEWVVSGEEMKDSHMRSSFVVSKNFRSS